MKLNIILTKEFYPILKYWWESHDFTPVDIDMLPEKVFVVVKDDTPIYSMFLYETNSKLCWIAWQLGNPDVSKEIKKGGLTFLIKEVTKYAEKLGYKFSFTTSPVKVIQEALMEEGYLEGDIKINHYLKII
jgi:urease accessory protein UreE